MTTLSDRASAASAIRSVVALPVMIAVVVPALIIVIDRWKRPPETPSLVIGTIMGLAGAAMVTRTALDVFSVGRGTLAPWDPPRRLVTIGLFAHCRNPMYLGVLAVLAGLAMASRSPILGCYLLAAAAAFHLRVVRHEEPWAARAFPDDWLAYRSAVPRWVPRIGLSSIR